LWKAGGINANGIANGQRGKPHLRCTHVTYEVTGVGVGLGQTDVQRGINHARPDRSAARGQSRAGVGWWVASDRVAAEAVVWGVRPRVHTGRRAASG
jgi:hypothetical protein